MDALRSEVRRSSWVVLVDGNSACHATADHVLSGSPWQLAQVEDALDGLCAVVEHSPLAVLLDEGCTPLDPWEFAQLVKHHPHYRHVKIIVMCKRIDVLTRAKARAFAVDGLLQKPFAADEVLALLGDAKDAAA